MPHDSLKSFLTTVIEEELSRNAAPQARAPGVRRGTFGMRSHASTTLPEQIADNLLIQAIASGLPLTRTSTERRPLSGGNTAELVARLTLHAPFVFKMDEHQKKLAEEGEMMRKVKGDPRLPERYRNAWPVVYAIRNEAPYAYLMELFPEEEKWESLEDRLYPKNGKARASDQEAVRLMHAILDILFEGFEASVDTRQRPSVQVDYVDRISQRLAEAAAFDPRFRSQPLRVNGVQLEPWEYYVSFLRQNEALINSISPRFSTVVHGDPNPGNLMLRTTTAQVELKLIDPKEWGSGDYLFDITKLTHFLEVTGPIEKPEPGAEWAQRYEEAGGSATLTYSATAPSSTEMLVDACRDRVAQFASRHDDPSWEARYELGMASNLLGLPIGRLKNSKKPRPDAALALYSEGLLWLARFCERVRGSAPTAALPISAAARHAVEVEPEPIRRARDQVRASLPHARQGEDRRGFQLLHWDSPRGNEGGKPLELSLEHEARLMPASARALTELQRALTASEGLPAGEHLLPGDTVHGNLIVRRYERAPGAQSVDRYYDLRGVEREKRLIPRMLSLRERARTSDFMTWAAAGEKRPLNLELPIVALEDTGVVVRLEFNWIDDLARAFTEFSEGAGAVAVSPLYLASRVEEFDTGPFEAVIEHTTYREKYMLVRPAAGETGEEQLFQVNVDHVVAQSLRTRRIGTYTDIDIAPNRRVDTAELEALIAFTRALADRYQLVPAGNSKVWRDALVTGELD